METLERLGEQGGQRAIRFPGSLSRWSVSCIITSISQFSLLLALFYSPSLSLLPNLFLSGAMLLIVAVVAKVLKRLLNLRASAPALVFLNMLYLWLVYLAVLRPAISPSRSILLNGSLVLLVFGFFRILGSDPGLVRENNFNLDDIMHFPDSYSSNHEASYSMRRVRYCKICKDNVRGFDHHCPAFGNCIGERNHILFMVLLIGFIAVESLYILCTAEFTKKYEMRRKKSEIINPVNVAASTMFFCLLQVLWQVVFLSWHIYCIGCNIRTDEWINWKKYPEFQLMVTSVKSARQVIDALNAEGHDIDIILLEVDLHLKKGFKLLKYIMRDKELQRIPVIMMSAQDEVSTVVKCLSLSRTCKALAYQ